MKGVEPLTCGLRNRCSATELHRPGRVENYCPQYNISPALTSAGLPNDSRTTPFHCRSNCARRTAKGHVALSLPKGPNTWLGAVDWVQMPGCQVPILRHRLRSASRTQKRHRPANNRVPADRYSVHSMLSHGGLAQAAVLRGLGLIVSWPGRHRKAQEPQCDTLFCTKLKCPPGGDNQCIPSRHRNSGNRLRPGRVGRTTPHLASPLKNVPDLLDGLMVHRPGYLPCTQGHLNHAGAPGKMPSVDQHPDFRTVRGYDVRLRGTVA